MEAKPLLQPAAEAAPPKEDLARDAINTVTHLGLAAALTMALGLVLRLVLPRAIGRDNLGILYFCESFSAMFFTFLPLGLAAYIVREVPVNHKQAGVILPTITPALGVLAAILWTAMMGFLLVTGSDRLTLVCAAAMGVYSAALVFQRTVLRRTYLALGQSALTARLEVVVRIALVLMVLIAVALGASVVAIVLCYALSEAAGVLYLLARAKRDGHFRERFDGRLLKSMVLQSLPFFAVGALVEIYGNINVSMLRYLADVQEVAYFGAADKLKGMGLLLVPIMQAALQPVLSKAWRGDKDEFQRLVSNSMRLLSAVSLPLTLGLMLVPDLLSDLIFGSEFAAAYRTISFLAPVLTLTYLNVLMGSCLNIVSDGKKFLWITGFSLLLNVGLNFTFIKTGAALWGVGGAAAGSSLATVVSELFVLMTVRRIFPQGLNHWHLLALALLSLLPCAALGSFLVPLLSINRWLRLALALLTPAYLFITRMVRPADIRWFIQLRFGKRAA